MSGGGVWNGAPDGKSRRLAGKLPSSDEAIAAAEAAIAEGERSLRWWPPECDWRQTKKGDGFYRKHNGMTISVKQAQSGSWYAKTAGALLGQGGRPTWFATPAEARNAADSFANGTGGWTWVGRKEEAVHDRRPTAHPLEQLGNAIAPTSPAPVRATYLHQQIKYDEIDGEPYLEQVEVDEDGNVLRVF
jgi:hypothetical protein